MAPPSGVTAMASTATPSRNLAVNDRSEVVEG